MISRRRKDVWGGRLYQTDCKLTANKGGNRKSITEPSGGIR